MAIQIVKSLIVLNLWNQMKECQKIHNRKMHPTGLEPATKASEAYVLSIRLRVHIQHSYSSTKHELVL